MIKCSALLVHSATHATAETRPQVIIQDMAAVLDGPLPGRLQTKRLPTTSTASTWGDPSITMPILPEQTATFTARRPSTSSCNSKSKEPLTPPKNPAELGSIIILGDDGPQPDHRNGRASITINIPLPWRRRPSRSRKSSADSKIIKATRAKTSAPRLLISEPDHVSDNVDMLTDPPDSSLARMSALRSRAVSRGVGSSLSPVAEGFARTNTHAQSGITLAPPQYASTMVSSNDEHKLCASREMPTETICDNSATTGSELSQTAPSRDDKSRQSARTSPQIGLGITGRMRASSQGPTVHHPRGPSIGHTISSDESLTGLHAKIHAVSPAIASRRSSYHDPNIAPTRCHESSSVAGGLAARRKSSMLGSHPWDAISYCRGDAIDSHEEHKLVYEQRRSYITPDPIITAPPFVSQPDSTRYLWSVEQPLLANETVQHTPTPHTSPRSLDSQSSSSTCAEPKPNHTNRSRTVYDEVKDDYRRLIHDVAATTTDSEESHTRAYRGASASVSHPARLPYDSLYPATISTTSIEAPAETTDSSPQSAPSNQSARAQPVQTSTATISQRHSLHKNPSCSTGRRIKSPIPIAIVKRWSDDYGAGEELHPHDHHDHSSPCFCPSLGGTDILAADAVNDINANTDDPSSYRPHQHQRHNPSGLSAKTRSSLGSGGLLSSRFALEQDGFVGDGNAHDYKTRGESVGNDVGKSNRTKLVPSGNELWS